MEVLIAAALWAGAAFGAEETPSACSAAYRKDSETLWELSEESWKAACGAGRQSAELLRSAQQAFIRKCATTFVGAVEKKRTNAGTVAAFCARGAPGRAELIESLGLSLGPSIGEAAAPEGSKGEALPGSGGMGPMTAAVAAAKAKWGDDLCLAAMFYAHWPEKLNKEKLVQGHSDLIPYGDNLEKYDYHFYSAAKWEEGYVVRYFDKIDHAFKILEERLRGPELERGPKVSGNDCLQKVDTEPQAVIKNASKEGIVVGEGVGVKLYLLSPDSWSEFAGKCERGLNKGYTFWCKRALTRGQKEKVRGKEIWLVSNGERTALFDAANGDFLFLINDELKPFPDLEL